MNRTQRTNPGTAIDLRMEGGRFFLVETSERRADLARWTLTAARLSELRQSPDAQEFAASNADAEAMPRNNVMFGLTVFRFFNAGHWSIHRRDILRELFTARRDLLAAFQVPLTYYVPVVFDGIGARYWWKAAHMAEDAFGYRFSIGVEDKEGQKPDVRDHRGHTVSEADAIHHAMREALTIVLSCWDRAPDLTPARPEIGQ